MHSSAGQGMNAILPEMSFLALAWTRPMAAPSMEAICELWPQAWAAPVAGSHSGCVGMINESISPQMARDGPGLTPFRSARMPVMERLRLGVRPMSVSVLAARSEVLNSL